MGKELEHFLNHYKFRKVNNVAYGIYKGYLISFSTLPGMVKLSIELGKNVDDYAINELSKKLDELKMNYKNINSASFGYLSIDILFIKTINVDQIICDVLYIITNFMSNNNIPGVDTCPICNRYLASNEPMIKIGSVVYQVHSACLKNIQALEQYQNRKVTYENVKKHSYFTGFLGALMGVMLFSFVWILTYSSSIAVSLLSIPMLVVSKVLYEKLKGKKDGKEMLILLVLNCLGIFVSIICGFTLYMSKENQIDFFSQFSQIFSMLTIQDNFRFFLGQLLIGYLCFAITFGVLKSLFKYNVDSTSKIEIIRQ